MKNKPEWKKPLTYIILIFFVIISIEVITKSLTEDDTLTNLFGVALFVISIFITKYIIKKL